MCHLGNHRRFPTKIIGRVIWILMSLDAPNESKLSRTMRPLGGQESTKEIEKGTLFDHEDVEHLTRTGRPVSGLKSRQTCVFMPTTFEEEDQTRMGRPVKVEELDIDFRVPGLCSCESSRTSRSSRACKEDRKSSLSRSTTSSRFAAE